MNNPNDSPSPAPTIPQQLHSQFHRSKSQQNQFFHLLTNKWTILDDSVRGLEKIIGRLEDRVRVGHLGGGGGGDRMAELRDKQKEFIIAELEGKVRRIQASQESVQLMLAEKQANLFDLQYRYEDLRLENTDLKQQLSKKTKQIKQLIKTNSTLKYSKAATTEKPVPQATTTLNLSELGTKKEMIQMQSQNYEEIQMKLKDMEDCLNGEIQQYRRKNGKLEEEIAGLKKQAKKQAQNTRKILELQIRIKNLTRENTELQQSYTSQIALTNDTQLKFHKKISDLKSQVQECKKYNKQTVKDVEKQLRKLSAAVLGVHDKGSIFIGTVGLAEQFGELAKEIVKCHKKQMNSLTMEKDTIIQQLKSDLQLTKTKLKQSTLTIQKLRASKISAQKLDKSPVSNGHSISNKSNSKSEIEKQKQREKEATQKLEKTEHKYEMKIGEMRANLQEKEKQINIIRKKHDQIETQLSKKVIALQTRGAELQMQLKYQEQKLAHLLKNTEQQQNGQKQTHEKQILSFKQKIKQHESLKDELRSKIRESEQKLYAKQKLIKQLQKREKEAAEKVKKVEKKQEQKQQQFKSALQNRDKTIQGLIQKNQNLLMEIKLVKQKAKLMQLSLRNKTGENEILQQQEEQKQIQKTNSSQYQVERQVLNNEINKKDQEIQQLLEQIQQKRHQIKVKEQKISDLTIQANKYQNQIKLLKNQNDILKQNSQKVKETAQKPTNFSQLKQEYEKREKMLKIEGQKIISDLKNSRKQLQSDNRRINEQKSLMKQEIEKLKNALNAYEQQKSRFNLQKFKDSQRQRKVIKDYDSKISILNTKIHQLQEANKKTQVQKPASQDKKAKKSFKMTDSTQYISTGVGTEHKNSAEIGVNTVDMFAIQTQNKGQMNRFLDFNDDQPNLMDSSVGKKEQAMKNSNLFMNLNNDNAPNEDVFEICDEEEQVNFGQSSLNLQVKELFTGLRLEIQKLFNQEDISFGVTKLLPQGLQDDYYQMMGYIKQKISQIKVHNEISFIMAEPGNEPEPLDSSLHLPQLVHRANSQGQSLRKIVQQQQAVIHSLMAQKTQQQNTINQLTLQKQQIEEQNENKFMNQCNLYKKQIKQHKKNIDLLEMNFQSMKNVIRNVLEAFCENEDMEDDFRDSMTLYARVGKLSEKERSRINYYIARYLEIKGLGVSE